MPFPSDFINRRAEQNLLKDFASRRLVARVLTFVIKALHGKTYLMLWFEQYCREQGIPVARLDFDRRNRDAMTYWKFVSSVRDELGTNSFPEVNLCESHHGKGSQYVKLQFGTGESGILLGEEGEYTDAKFEGFTGRDRVDIQQQYFEATNREEQQRKREAYEMGRAFGLDIGSWCHEKSLVLILDTYEHVTDETAEWINEWIFERLPTRYPNLFVVIAGRPEMSEKLGQGKPWQTLMKRFEIFSQPNEEDVVEYIRFHNLEMREGEVSILLRAAGDKMGNLAMLRDMLGAQPGEMGN